MTRRLLALLALLAPCLSCGPEGAAATDRILFIGFDASDKLIEGLEAGEIDALVVQNPFAMGDLAVRVCVESIRGQEVEARIDTGATVVTRANMAQHGALLAPELSSIDARPPGDEERLQVAVIPKGTTHQFWRAVHAGAAHAGLELGVEVIWKGPLKEDDREAQVQVVEDFVTRGVDGIVLAPTDESALVAPCEEAAAKHIPVVIFDSDLKWGGRESFVATDNYLGGVYAAEHMAELIGGEGRVLVLRYQEGSASTMRREAGFLETIENDYPGIEVVSSEQRSGATVAGAITAAENLLQRFPDVDGVFTPCEPVATGMLIALRNAGRTGR